MVKTNGNFPHGKKRNNHLAKNLIYLPQGKSLFTLPHDD
jgi:hypothetical protein